MFQTTNQIYIYICVCVSFCPNHIPIVSIIPHRSRLSVGTPPARMASAVQGLGQRLCMLLATQILDKALGNAGSHGTQQRPMGNP